MRLFDVLTPAEYTRLKFGLPVSADPEDPDMLDFSVQYVWLGRQLRNRVAPGFTEDLIHPRIAYCPDLGQGMPEIAWKVREGNRMISRTFYVVEFELPEEQILLFDDSMWVCALNNGPIAGSPKPKNSI